MPDDPAIIESLQHVSSATVTTILLKHGLRNVWMRGTRPPVRSHRLRPVPRHPMPAVVVHPYRARPWRIHHAPRERDRKG
jgi:hypothetical protein